MPGSITAFGIVCPRHSPRGEALASTQRSGSSRSNTHRDWRKAQRPAGSGLLHLQHQQFESHRTPSDFIEYKDHCGEL